MLMILCYNNQQLLIYDWAVDLVQQQSGKIDNEGYIALIKLFRWKPEKTNFNSNSFKLLWKMEKNIKIDKLKEYMHKKSELKNKVIAAVAEAVAYY